MIGLERKVNELQDELRRKDEKVVEGKKLVQTLAKDDEWLNSKFSVDYQLLRENKNEKNILMAELEHFKDKAGRLQEELQKRLMRLRKEDNYERNCSNRLFGMTLKCQRTNSI